jgi:tRNA threonylcarbamoyladenosine biosynthesis protein TsaE
MATYISRSPAETAAIGEQWGREAQDGLVIGLSGDLGAGKTELVKGLARGLNIPERVHSPTFALVNIYKGGRLSLFHLDLYRLETPEKIIAAGLEEYLQPAGVTVIEWIDRWFPHIAQHATRNTQYDAPANMIRVTIEELDPTTRRITHETPRS